MIDIDWLKDHVEVPEGLTYEQLAKDLVKVEMCIRDSGTPEWRSRR